MSICIKCENNNPQCREINNPENIFCDETCQREYYIGIKYSYKIKIDNLIKKFKVQLETVRNGSGVSYPYLEKFKVNELKEDIKNLKFIKTQSTIEIKNSIRSFESLNDELNYLEKKIPLVKNDEYKEIINLNKQEIIKFENLMNPSIYDEEEKNKMEIELKNLKQENQNYQKIKLEGLGVPNMGIYNDIKLHIKKMNSRISAIKNSLMSENYDHIRRIAKLSIFDEYRKFPPAVRYNEYKLQKYR